MNDIRDCWSSSIEWVHFMLAIDGLSHVTFCSMLTFTNFMMIFLRPYSLNQFVLISFVTIVACSSSWNGPDTGSTSGAQDDFVVRNVAELREAPILSTRNAVELGVPSQLYARWSADDERIRMVPWMPIRPNHPGTPIRQHLQELRAGTNDLRQTQKDGPSLFKALQQGDPEVHEVCFRSIYCLPS